MNSKNEEHEVYDSLDYENFNFYKITNSRLMEDEIDILEKYDKEKTIEILIKETMEEFGYVPPEDEQSESSPFYEEEIIKNMKNLQQIIEQEGRERDQGVEKTGKLRVKLLGPERMFLRGEIMKLTSKKINYTPGTELNLNSFLKITKPRKTRQKQRMNLRNHVDVLEGSPTDTFLFQNYSKDNSEINKWVNEY